MLSLSLLLVIIVAIDTIIGDQNVGTQKFRRLTKILSFFFTRSPTCSVSEVAPKDEGKGIRSIIRPNSEHVVEACGKWNEESQEAWNLNQFCQAIITMCGTSNHGDFLVSGAGLVSATYLITSGENIRMEDKEKYEVSFPRLLSLNIKHTWKVKEIIKRKEYAIDAILLELDHPVTDSRLMPICLPKTPFRTTKTQEQRLTVFKVTAVDDNGKTKYRVENGSNLVDLEYKTGAHLGLIEQTLPLNEEFKFVSGAPIIFKGENGTFMLVAVVINVNKDGPPSNTDLQKIRILPITEKELAWISEYNK